MAEVVARSLTKTYPKGPTALADVSFALRSGEAVAIIGPSGAGKTTLFRVLSRNTPLERGSVQFDGSDLYGASYLHLAKLRRRIGIVFQQHNLVGELSVLHNVLIGRLGRWSTWSSLRSLLLGPPPDLYEAARSALASVALEDKIGVKADNLSGGEQQRVAVARLTVQDPDVVLADEPVASVDPFSAHMIIESFLELASRGKTVVCNLHDVSLARQFFPRILALRDGVLIFDGETRELEEDRLLEIYGGHRWDESDGEHGARSAQGRGVLTTAPGDGAGGSDSESCTCEEKIVRRILQSN